MVDIDQHAAAISKTASTATYALAGTLAVGDYIDFLNENSGFIGVLIGVATFAVNWYYRRKEFKRDSVCKPN